MKTNDKDIEMMAREYSHKTWSHDPYDQNDIECAYESGFKACEAKMLAEASEGFVNYYYHSDIFKHHEDTARAAFTAGAMSQAKKLNEDYESGKELNHEDLFRLLKHQQKSAEINLRLYNEGQEEIQKLKELAREMIEENATNREKIERLKADREITVKALKLISMDNIYVGENGWRDENFLNVKQAREALKSIGEIE